MNTPTIHYKKGFKCWVEKKTTTKEQGKKSKLQIQHIKQKKTRRMSIIYHPKHWFHIRTQTAQQGIMGPFNLSWKTSVILVKGITTDQYSLFAYSDFSEVLCLSINPPIVFVPRFHHSSEVLATEETGLLMNSHQNRDDLDVRNLNLCKITNWAEL